ncbi:MAG: hypothetical protein JRN52_09350 [Nitrososphaerota archaeon]|nr:hypothetical protein [Nitrososphaerota archaeon]
MSSAQDEEVAPEGSEEAEIVKVLELDGRYAYFDGETKIEESECRITLMSDSVLIDSDGGAHYEFHYRELNKIEELPSEYLVTLSLADGISFQVDYLGAKYADFLNHLYQLRNDQLEQDLLIQEGKASFITKGKIAFSDVSEPSQGEARIYKTRLAFFPKVGEPVCLRFSDISSFKFEDYVAEFLTSAGPPEKISISDLGNYFETFQRSFTAANRLLLQEINDILKRVYPAISSSNLLRLSRKMMDGIPVPLIDIAELEPLFLKSIELQISSESEDLGKSHQYLYTIGDKRGSFIGAKRFVSDFLYILIPMKARNAVALETNEKGHATYFFKTDSENSIQEIASALREINFRREPVYLTDEDLLKPQYSKYLFSIQRIKSLKALRDLFIGRAIHGEFEAWKSQVEGLLKIV